MRRRRPDPCRTNGWRAVLSEASGAEWELPADAASALPPAISFSLPAHLPRDACGLAQEGGGSTPHGWFNDREDEVADDVCGAIDAELARWCRQQVRERGPHAPDVVAAMAEMRHSSGGCHDSQALLTAVSARPAGGFFLHAAVQQLLAQLRSVWPGSPPAQDMPGHVRKRARMAGGASGREGSGAGGERAGVGREAAGARCGSRSGGCGGMSATAVAEEALAAGMAVGWGASDSSNATAAAGAAASATAPTNAGAAPAAPAAAYACGGARERVAILCASLSRALEALAASDTAAAETENKTFVFLSPDPRSGHHPAAAQKKRDEKTAPAVAAGTRGSAPPVSTGEKTQAPLDRRPSPPVPHVRDEPASHESLLLLDGTSPPIDELLLPSDGSLPYCDGTWARSDEALPLFDRGGIPPALINCEGAPAIGCEGARPAFFSHPLTPPALVAMAGAACALGLRCALPQAEKKTQAPAGEHKTPAPNVEGNLPTPEGEKKTPEKKTPHAPCGAIFDCHLRADLDAAAGLSPLARSVLYEWVRLRREWVARAEARRAAGREGLGAAGCGGEGAGEGVGEGSGEGAGEGAEDKVVERVEERAGEGAGARVCGLGAVSVPSPPHPPKPASPPRVPAWPVPRPPRGLPLPVFLAHFSARRVPCILNIGSAGAPPSWSFATLRAAIGTSA